MKRKLTKLALCCFVLAGCLFALSFGMFHYLTDSGFTAVWQPEAGKPFVTEMVADAGVLFFCSGILCRMIAAIFFPDEK